jgi:peptidoglycan/LPS O-acetylase OafA/YrhL
LEGYNIKGRIPELDVLRGLAAVIVFLFHCELILPPSRRIFDFGVTGVDLFFMISGFVILLTLEKTNHWKEFVVSRFAKLFPTYWACVSFTAILILFRSMYLSIPVPGLLAGYLGNLTMFQRYAGIANLDEQYWTMEVEMLFYLVMLLVFIKKKLDRIENIGFAGLTFIVIYDILLEAYFPLNRYFILIDHFALFFAGILFYKIRSQEGNLVRYLGIAYCFAVTCILFNNGGRSMFYIPLAEYTVMISIYFVLFFLITFNYLGFIVQKPLIFMGQVSYSFYLIHQYISTKIVIPTLQRYLDMNFYLAVASAFCISLFLAFLITSYIEKPSMKYWKQRFVTRTKLKNN